MSDGTDDATRRKREAGSGFKLFLILCILLIGGVVWWSGRGSDDQADALAVPDLDFGGSQRLAPEDKMVVEVLENPAVSAPETAASDVAEIDGDDISAPVDDVEVIADSDPVDAPDGTSEQAAIDLDQDDAGTDLGEGAAPPSDPSPAANAVEKVEAEVATATDDTNENAVETAVDQPSAGDEQPPVTDTPSDTTEIGEAEVGAVDIASTASATDTTPPQGATADQDDQAATQDQTTPSDSSADPSLPSFDLVRIDASGGGLVAGRAAPGSTIRVLADGQEIAVAEASAKGEFVAFIQTPASNEGQLLSLAALTAAGEVINSSESVLIVPGQGEEDANLAPALLKAEPAGVRIIQPLGLAKVSNVTLDVITYDVTGAVLLSGRAPKAQPIRIYVDGSAVTELSSSDDGTWEARLPNIEAGRYVLRVDALRDDGSVETRAESPFQRVYPTAEQQKQLSVITVQPGNTLWVMAQERYGDGFLYSQIFAANKGLIRDPDLIYPGQIFELPE